MSWVNKLRRLALVTALSLELVRFDLQQLENPEISGIQYQQGMLYGFEVKEYLLAKWDRQCAYCNKSEVPLEVEQIVARARGGSHRLSNLTLACQPCNQAKGARAIEDFLRHQPERLKKTLAQAQMPLKDAAAVNSTRLALFNALTAAGLEISTDSGGLTKYNRQQHQIPKSHALDAACVGRFTTLSNWNLPCNGQQKPDTCSGSVSIKFPFELDRGLIAQC
jgi:5-methylcytosine-specific restriction endonuclease McrA